MEDEKPPHIIIENGSYSIKAGLSGEEGPRAVFSSCVGYTKYSDAIIVGNDGRSFFVGKDAEDRRGILKLHYPIEKGIINNFDEMEKIWRHIFTNELCSAPELHNTMLIVSPMESKENKEKMVEIMFETFNVPGLYIKLTSELALYSHGKLEGTVLDLGDGVNYCSSICDGHSIPGSLFQLDITGRDLTEYMTKVFKENGKNIITQYEKEICRCIKEKACYVALDFEDEIQSVNPYDYELPDGTHIDIKDIRIQCPEIFFKPSLIEKEGDNIAQICYKSIQKCDIDKRKELYSNIVLSGGSSLFKGLQERLTKEIKKLVPEIMKEQVKVISSPERRYSTWIGGSILTNNSAFNSMWITKTEYEESGAIIVHSKCLI